MLVSSVLYDQLNEEVVLEMLEDEPERTKEVNEVG